ncbi:MAG: DUF5719 family protein [Acidimicrobiales bacterium]
MTRKVARHRRRRRFTPRRWLPFVLLIGLVVGAAVIDPGTPTVDPTKVDSSLDLTTLPTVTAVDAISTAFYCSGGTAMGEGGDAELSVVLANDDRRGATADITVFDRSGAQGTKQVSVPAHGRARVALSSMLEAPWAAALVEVRGGRVAVDREVSGPLGFDSAPCSTEAADRWFVPSGTTVREAEEYLTLFNPFPDPANVNIVLATETGLRTPRRLQRLSVPARSVQFVKVGETVTDRKAVAATVRALAGRVVVDRVQTYSGNGDPIGKGEAAAAPKGLVSTAASPVRAPRWVFPSARVDDGVRTQVAVYNPGSRTAQVDVALHYQEPQRNGTVEPVSIEVPARRQVVVDLDEVPGIEDGVDMWIDVRSLDGVPVVAERLSYYGAPSKRRGAAASLGSPQQASRWLVTQAGPTRLRSGTVQVANVGDTPARITVVQLVAGDRVPVPGASVTIPPRDRRTLDLGDLGPAASVVVRSDRPVVVGSSLSLATGLGIAVQPAFAYPETLAPLPPVS